MNPPATWHPDPATLDALAEVVALLDGARLAADAATAGDPLSPWANVAASAHLAAAGLQCLLPWPPEVRMVGDCAATLHAAAGALTQLESVTPLPTEELIRARGWIATALAQIWRLQPT